MGIETGVLLAYAAIAGSTVAVGSALMQASAADDMADAQQRQGQADADYAASAAQVQASQIRKAGERQRAEARASLSGSGVTVGTGSAELIDTNIQRGSEEDALMAIYDGKNNASSIQRSADLGAAQSRNSASAARMSAASSALSGAAAAGKGWNTKNTKPAA